MGSLTGAASAGARGALSLRIARQPAGTMACHDPVARSGAKSRVIDFGRNGDLSPSNSLNVVALSYWKIPINPYFPKEETGNFLSYRYPKDSAVGVWFSAYGHLKRQMIFGPTALSILEGHWDSRVAVATKGSILVGVRARQKIDPGGSMLRVGSPGGQPGEMLGCRPGGANEDRSDSARRSGATAASLDDRLQLFDGTAVLADVAVRSG